IQPGSLDDLLAFSDAERQRLFDIDVFTGVASINGNRNMPVVGGGNEDCIDILLSQQVSVFSKLLSFPSDLFLGLIQTLVIDVAERHNLNFRVLLKMSEHAAPALAWANHTQAYSLISSQDLGPGTGSHHSHTQSSRRLG